MKVILYHSTGLGNINSIMEKGLVPGFHTSPYQDWKAKYSGHGIYFCSQFMDHALWQHTVWGPGEEDNVPIVIEVETEVNSEEIIPEEEEIGWNNDPEPGQGIKYYNKGGAVVVLRKIEPKDIKKIYYPNVPWVKDYIIDFCNSPGILVAYDDV